MGGTSAAEHHALPEFLDTLRWRWRLVLLVFLAVAAGSILYAESLPDRYEAQAIVSVAPRTAEVSPTVVTVGAPKYVAYATAPATIDDVAFQLREESRELRNAIDATLAAETGDITISAELRSPDRAARVANAFAREVVSFSVRDDLLQATITAPATAPPGPTRPPRRLIEGAALVVALVVAVGTALLLERIRPGVRTWRDIAERTGFSVVGRIPRAKAMRTAPSRALVDPAVGASVRMLRTNLEREVQAMPRGIMAVTSATPGEGKTAVAGVVATAFAQLGARVLLVDGDVQQATLSRRLRIQDTGGLWALLRVEAPLEANLERGWVPGLSVLGTTAQRDPGDAVARRFRGVAEQARQLFDLVVVDTAPLLGSDVSSAIVTVADGTLFVVSAGTSPEALSEAVVALRGLRASVWGVVANRLRTGPAGALPYGYYAVNR